MNSIQVFPAALLLLFCLVDSGAGLMCYQCNSYEKALCADPFFFDDGTAKSGKEFLLPCPPDEPAKEDGTPAKNYFCRKIYQNVRGEERVIRSCGWEDHAKDKECYSTVLEEYNTYVCKCTEDGCNSASMFSVSSLAVGTALALGLLMQ